MKIVKDVRDIKRVPLAHVDDVVAELKGQVLKEAFENFDYCAESFGASGSLAKALYSVGVIPLNTDQVDQYKASKNRQYTTHPSTWVKWVLAGGPLVISVALNYYWHLTAAKDFEPFFGLPIALGVLAAVVSWLTGSFIIEEWGLLQSRIYKWEWRTYELGRSAAKYKRYIPIHVLNKANLIKQECRYAEFYVDELSLSIKDAPRPMPDPFMWVKLGAEKFYIDVWDEREFEAKM